MIDEFLTLFERNDPKSLKSIQHAREVSPELFDAVGRRILTTLSQTFPERSLGDFAQTYSIYTFEQNRLQARYERTGKYPFASHAVADSAVYQNTAVMADYMTSLLLTQFLWPHHLEIVRFFLDRFVPLIGEEAKILEMAPGHGFYGRLVLERRSRAQLLGVDISPLCISLASKMAAIEGYAGRASYQQGDALLGGEFLPECNAVIAGELLEHLDQPRLLIEAVTRQLSPGGVVFITAAITAANVDHVYEFKDAGEVLALLNGTDLKVMDRLLVAPSTIRPGTTKIPRVLAMILSQ